MLRHLLNKRTIAVAGAALILVGAAATVGAAGGVSEVAGNVGDVLDALQITDRTPDAADEHLDAIEQPDVAGGQPDGLGPPDDLGPSSSVEVCHAPPDNTGNAHTISVGGEDALDEHLAHGDSVGACAETGSTGSPDGIEPSSSVEVCHVPPDNQANAHSISVGEGALDGHLAHGDSVGACAETGSPGSPDGSGPSSSVEVCHVPPDNQANAHSISVGEGALEEHLSHGDSVGACAETGSEG